MVQLKASTFCPLVQGECKQLGCSWFTQLRGTNPNTGEEIDEWGCAVTWLPILLVENAKQGRQTRSDHGGPPINPSFLKQILRTPHSDTQFMADLLVFVGSTLLPWQHRRCPQTGVIPGHRGAQNHSNTASSRLFTTASGVLR